MFTPSKIDQILIDGDKVYKHRIRTLDHNYAFLHVDEINEVYNYSIGASVSVVDKYMLTKIVKFTSSVTENFDLLLNTLLSLKSQCRTWCITYNNFTYALWINTIQIRLYI